MERADSRLPATLSVSMLLHAGGLGLWLYFSRLPKQEQNRILTNVELMIASRPAAVPAAPRAAAPPNTWNFLKMALPSVPKPLDVETPKNEPKPLAEPVRPLQDNQRKMLRSLDSLSEKDLGHRKPAASLEDAALAEHVAHPKLADDPRLEEVGNRQAPKSVLAMQALADERKRDSGLQPLSALAAEPTSTRPSRSTAMQMLPEASPPPTRSPDRSVSGLSALLPAETSYRSRAGGPLQAAPMDAPAPEKRKAEALGERKKATTIEGPLQGRKILHAEVPRFPAWAQAQGVLEATVRIRFTVDASGKVLEDIQLQQTSGYGELDRLAMDSLRSWLFVPKPEGFGNQWGIITFRFVME